MDAVTYPSTVPRLARALEGLTDLPSLNNPHEISIVAELIRSANARRLPTGFEVRHLLQRSVVEIRDMREHVGIPGSGTSQDAVIGIMAIAARVEDVPDDDVRNAFLEAADMIRTLRIVAESGLELSISVSGSGED